MTDVLQRPAYRPNHVRIRPYRIRKERGKPRSEYVVFAKHSDTDGINGFIYFAFFKNLRPIERTPGFSLWPLCSLWSLRAGLTLLSLRPLRSLRSNLALFSLRTD